MFRCFHCPYGTSDGAWMGAMDPSYECSIDNTRSRNTECRQALNGEQIEHIISFARGKSWDNQSLYHDYSTKPHVPEVIEPAPEISDEVKVLIEKYGVETVAKAVHSIMER